MGKDFFDWEQDPELSTTAKVVNFPLTEDQKFRHGFDALEKGFTYSNSGMLQKEVSISRKNQAIVEYDPRKVKLDEVGRKYFYDEDLNKVYFDDMNNIYSIRVSAETHQVEEYIVLDSKELLVFTDASHMVGVTKNGFIYEYDEQTGSYIYNPKIVLHPNMPYNR